MARPRQYIAFSQARDDLNNVIADQRDLDDLRDALKKHKGALSNLHRAVVAEGRGLEKHDGWDSEFVDTIIGDGADQARVKILATVLALDAGPTTELWVRFMSALSVAQPEGRDEDFRDACLPHFTLAYIERQLGSSYAANFEAKLYDFCIPEPSSALEDKIQELRQRVEEARRSYKTIRTTRQRSNSGRSVVQKYADSEDTGHFWPDGVASTIVDANEDLVQSLRVEHLKAMDSYGHATSAERGRALRDSRAQAGKFMDGARKRAKILAILLYSGASHRDLVWNLFVDACLGARDCANEMLDQHLPYTPDTILDVFGSKTPQNVRDNFHSTQFAFCPIKIRPPDRELPVSSIPLAHAHFPFREKLHCGDGTSSDVFHVQVEPGHLQYGDSKQWNQRAVRLTMKTMPFDKETNREAQVNNLIYAQEFKHKHIVNICGIEILQDAVLIFMEPADCNLYEYMTKHCTYPAATLEVAQQRLSMLTKIADAMTQLHEHLQDESKTVQFIHKDLKAENILVILGNPAVDGTNEEKILKVTDFGLSSAKTEGTDGHEEGHLKGGVQREVSSDTRLPDYTPHFAPESRESHRVTKKSDVWAFGTALAELLSWIARGSVALTELEESRDSKNYWKPDSEGVPRLAPGVKRWFLDLLAADDFNKDLKPMYAGCWCLLEHVALVCDPERRGSMRVVRDYLRKICEGEEDVQDQILSRHHGCKVEDKASRQVTIEEPPSVPMVTKAVSADRDTKHDSFFGDASTPAQKSSTLDLKPTKSASPTGNNAGLDDHDTSKRGRRSMLGRLLSHVKKDPESLPTSGDSSSSTGSSPAPDNVAQQIVEAAPVPSRAVSGTVGTNKRVDSTSATTELHKAAAGKDLQRLREVLDTDEGRRSIEVADNLNMTPLFYALRRRRGQAAAELIHQGADVNVVPKTKETALHYAVSRPPPEGDGDNLAAMILEQNPDLLGRKNSKGDTALHVLARHATEESVARLEGMLDAVEDADREASLAIRNKDEKIPRDLVRDPTQGTLSSGSRSKLQDLLTPNT